MDQDSRKRNRKMWPSLTKKQTKKKKQVEELRQAKAAEFTAFSECSNAEEYIDNGLFKASWSTKLCDLPDDRNCLWTNPFLICNSQVLQWK